MEPILLLTPFDGLTIRETSLEPAPAEADFLQVLAEHQSQPGKSRRDSAAIDPSGFSALLSVCQAMPGHGSAALPAVEPEGQQQNDILETAMPPIPVHSLPEEVYPNPAEVNETELLFSGDIVDQRSDRTAIPADPGKTVGVIPGDPAMSESPAVTSPSQSERNQPDLDHHSALRPELMDRPFDPAPRGTDPVHSDPFALSPALAGSKGEGSHSEIGGAPIIQLEGNEPKSSFTNPHSTFRTPNAEVPPSLTPHSAVPTSNSDELSALKEGMKESIGTLFSGDRVPIDSKAGNRTGFDAIANQGPGEEREVVPQYSKPGDTLTQKPPLDLSTRDEAAPPLLKRESEFSEKHPATQNEFLSVSEKKIENGLESALVLKPQGSQPSHPAPHEVAGPRGPVLPETETAGILQQVGKKLIWSIKNGEEQITLELKPPELGRLTIEIHRQNDNVQATLWTSNLGTKEILESHQVELQRILRQDGFHLEQFDVFVGQNMRSFQDGREGGVGHDHWTRASQEETHGPLFPDEAARISAGAFPGMKGDQHIDLII